MSTLRALSKGDSLEEVQLSPVSRLDLIKYAVHLEILIRFIQSMRKPKKLDCQGLLRMACGQWEI